MTTRRVAAILFVLAAPAVAAESRASVKVHPAAGPIVVDGDLSDPGWQGAAEVHEFFELSPGDNTPPKVRTTAYVTFDDRFFYVGMRCDDPDPRSIRTHFTERDRVGGEQDFAGIMLDTRHDRRTALELFVNPLGIQDDFVRDETVITGNNEDASPDFYWDSAARITATGWEMEMRIPFSTLRYSDADPQTWGIVFFRNWPRDFRYQIASNRSPRESNCFVCHEIDLEGMSGLPHGAHLVAAPYATVTERGVPRGDPGSSFVNRPLHGQGGIDAKFLPSENTAFDATFNPDFSQIESDVAQISADARFALFYPEKRPFFMEQSQLFNAPIQAVYTRTITAPRWGVRASGEFGSNVYTALVGEDRGGGTVILPGPTASSSADQDFRSFFGIGRIQHAFSDRSFASFLVTDREIEGGGHNRVFGPDFQWTPGASDQVVGQFLISATKTPDRPDLSSAWTGQTLDSRAMSLTWSHSAYHWNWIATYRDLGDNFRADDGFVPQVGIREGLANVSYNFYTPGFFSRVTPIVLVDEIVNTSGRAVTDVVEPGIAFQGKSNLFAEVDYNAHELERAGPNLLHNERWHLSLNANPPGLITLVSLDGHVGKGVDFLAFRSGRGWDLTFSSRARPTRHLEFQLDLAGQELSLEGQRLFRAQVERLKATYVLRANLFLRVVGQYVRTDFDPKHYPASVSVPKTEGTFDASALVGYQLDWQSVVYLGYGDSRTLSEQAQLQRAGRTLFLKVAYAFQH